MQRKKMEIAESPRERRDVWEKRERKKEREEENTGAKERVPLLYTGTCHKTWLYLLAHTHPPYPFFLLLARLSSHPARRRTSCHKLRKARARFRVACFQF